MTKRTSLSVTLVTRIHLPEPSAASLRLNAVEEELLDQAIPTSVLTSRSSHEPIEDPAGLTVSRWRTLRDGEGQLRGYLPYMSFDLPLVYRVLAATKPAVYLVEPPPTTGVMMRVLSRIRRRPYVWYAADVWSDATKMTGAPALIVKVVTAMEEISIRGASHVIAVSEGVAERVRGLGGKRVTVVPNGIDPRVFTPDADAVTADELSAHGIQHPYMIYAGTASEWQGAEIFIDALSELGEDAPEFQLVFIGQGSSWEDLKRRADDLSPLRSGARRVVVLGQLPFEHAARWQAAAIGALVAIRPGLGYDFAYPTKVLSALSCGVPVLFAGRGPVARDLVNPLLGTAVEYEASAVADGMRQIQKADIGADARRQRHQWVVDHRSTQAVGRKVVEILRIAAG